MLARVQSAALVGVDAVPVDVEVDVSSGLPAFAIAGLADASEQDAKERVRAAVKNSHRDVPARRILAKSKDAGSGLPFSTSLCPTTIGPLYKLLNSLVTKFQMLEERVPCGSKLLVAANHPTSRAKL